MAVRIVVDAAEDDLEKVAKDPLLAVAFLNAVLSKKVNHPLGNGVTISTTTNASVSGDVSVGDGPKTYYSYNFGYCRYREDQADVFVHGVNGTECQLPIQQAAKIK